MTSSATTSQLPFPGALAIAETFTPFEDLTVERQESERHRSQGTRLPRPRRHEAPRRRAQGSDGTVQLDAVPFGTSECATALPVGTRVRFERRSSTANSKDVQRAEFAQVAASYVFAAAVLACTFFV